MPQTQVENAFEFDGTDSHFLTLPRLHAKVREKLSKEAKALLSASVEMDETSDTMIGRPKGESGPGRQRNHLMSMPDARLLDHRLLEILAAIEGSEGSLNRQAALHQINSPGSKLRRDVLLRFHGPRLEFMLREYKGIGLAPSQCGTKHRTLNDELFGYGSASPSMAQVAYGTNAPS